LRRCRAGFTIGGHAYVLDRGRLAPGLGGGGRLSISCFDKEPNPAFDGQAEERMMAGQQEQTQTASRVPINAMSWIGPYFCGIRA
jgi:hypothetical protein